MSRISIPALVAALFISFPAYLGLCSRFWKMHEGRLDRWTKALREGETPDLVKVE